MKLRIENEKVYLNNIELGKTDNIFANHTKNFIEIDKQKLQKYIFPLSSSDFIEDLEIQYFSKVSDKDIGFSFSKIDNVFYVKCNFVFDLTDWNERISIKEFDLLINKYSSKENCFEIETSGFDAYSEKIYDVFFTYTFKNDIEIKKAINLMEEEFQRIKSEIINRDKIENTISFSSEHLTAGISILQYFGKLLQEKYPNEEVSVSIKQEGLKVTMTIETPDGKKEEIEEYLNRYGMVITNQITPQEFATNPIQLIELKQELREAQNKILFQQELLTLKDNTYKNRIISLEDEVNFLRKEFSEALLTNKENIQILLNSLLTKDKLIKKLTKSIENRNDVETKQLLLELKEKDSKGYISLKQHIDNIIVGNLTNTPAWIEFLITYFPK